MNQTLAIARKEWRAAFLSPVALIFLGIFLFASLFAFFFSKGFFARGIADARPFFQTMPLLLVFLASAFTMRLWSEEARSGTLELLLTLPLRARDLVLGKFLAGLGLVAVALLLTLPVPLTVAWLGELDWGPVLGGYLGLLLLASAYLALGMLISSLTSSQLVALLVSMVLGVALVLVGYLPQVMPLGVAGDEVLRALGTATRFESMLRGVLDLRDLVYYLSLAGLGLALNGLVLEVHRWGHSAGSRPRRRGALWAVGLGVLNLAVLNAGLAGFGGLRLDLTEWGEYSVSDVTRQMLRGADQPLLIRGYFSGKTHPLLEPLVPRIRDFLEELQAVGGANVTVEFVDPTENEALEREAQGKYGIQSVPFRFASRHEDSVVNAYFHLLVRAGDRHEVLSFQDLIDVEVQGTDVRVRLRNLEYDLARAVQKVVYGFKSTESICRRLDADAELTLVVSRESLPAKLKEVPSRIEKVAGEIKGRCGGRFEFTTVDPDAPGTALSREELQRRYGIRPMALSMFDQTTFYLDMVIRIGQATEVLSGEVALSEADLRRELEAALQRHTPGFLKTVGVLKSETPPQRIPGMPPQGPRPRDENLRRQLGETYQVKTVDLDTGRVPGDVDVLLLVAPRELGDSARFAVDQFLMRGGAVIAAAGGYAFEPSPMGELEVRPQPSGLEELLKHYGVEVDPTLVLDEQNSAFPVPVVRDLGGIRVREIKLVQYPPFVQVRGEGLSRDNPATQALPAVTLQWVSPVRCSGTTGSSECQPLLWSSDQAWEVRNFSAQPDFTSYPELGYAAPAERGRTPLAAAVMGELTSYYKDHDPPLLQDSDATTGGDQEGEKGKTARRAGVIERSNGDARLVVVGSSAFLDDLVLSISSQVGDSHLSNLQFLLNLTDWAVEDAALLSIRTREQYARSLSVTGAGERIAWEAGNFGFALLAVAALGLITLGRRRRARPILVFDDRQREGR